MPGQMNKIAALANDLPQVVEAHRVTGEDCFIIKAHIKALENLDELLDRFLVFGQTTTSIVQSSPVLQRGLPIPVSRGARKISRKDAKAQRRKGKSEEVEGSRFGTWAKDLTYSFQCEEGQNIELNKRLPGITQRDVLSSGRFE